MAYIDKDGNVCDGNRPKGIIETILSFFTLIWLFIQSFFGINNQPSGYQPSSMDYRNVVRRGENGEAYRRFGGGGGGDGLRRNIGRLQDQSNIPPPPMGGGCCGGGGCG